MEVLVIGASNLGIRLAEILIEQGEDLVLLDDDQHKLNHADHLDCAKVLGHPLSREVLEQAGIKQVGAVLVVSDNENLNVMVGQIALKFYPVENIIARIDTPENEAMYQELGLQCVCSTSLTLAHIIALLELGDDLQQSTIYGYPVIYEQRELSINDYGLKIKQYQVEYAVHVIGIIQDDELLLVQENYELLPTDKVLILRFPD